LEEWGREMTGNISSGKKDKENVRKAELQKHPPNSYKTIVIANNESITEERFLFLRLFCLMPTMARTNARMPHSTT
jgi:hypothetical protein